MDYELEPIGIVRSPCRELPDAPHQGRLSVVAAEIIVYDEFAPGLKDIEQKPTSDHPHLA
jgi:tRNA (Thr-GGU) A37 N-methylase